ncbi:hypothetical protein QBC39DRAFT_110270 [Podospora conica]|nr:hypothetical protein QBC39DRAFT_110270 [Schizothecium conicum]
MLRELMPGQRGYGDAAKKATWRKVPRRRGSCEGVFCPHCAPPSPGSPLNTASSPSVDRFSPPSSGETGGRIVIVVGWRRHLELLHFPRSPGLAGLAVARRNPGTRDAERRRSRSISGCFELIVVVITSQGQGSRFDARAVQATYPCHTLVSLSSFHLTFSLIFHYVFFPSRNGRGSLRLPRMHQEPGGMLHQPPQNSAVLKPEKDAHDLFLVE